MDKNLVPEYLGHITFFLTLSKGCRCNKLSVIRPKTISYGSMSKLDFKFQFHGNWENTGKIIMHKISFSEIWSIWSLFSRGLPYEPFLWSYFIEPIFFFKALEKSKKECNMLEIILVQGFCPLKIKIIILIFLMDPS